MQVSFLPSHAPQSAAASRGAKKSTEAACLPWLLDEGGNDNGLIGVVVFLAEARLSSCAAGAAQSTS